jgi:hypothetical protein
MFSQDGGQQTAAWRWRDIALIAAFNLLLLGWVVLRPGSSAVFLAVDNVAQFLGPILVLALCLVSARRAARSGARGVQRWAPLLLGLGALCESLGQVIYTVYEQVLGFSTPPFPSWADAIYLWAYPFMLAGILLLPGRRLVGSSR